MEKYYYHITDPKNVESIMKEGLKANKDGEIFLFENKAISYKLPMIDNGVCRVCKVKTTIANIIALNQLFLNEFAMFEISSDGIKGELLPDNVAEYSAPFQHIAKQLFILPEYITLCGVFKSRKPSKTIRQTIIDAITKR